MLLTSLWQLQATLVSKYGCAARYACKYELGSDSVPLQLATCCLASKVQKAREPTKLFDHATKRAQTAACWS